MKQPKRRSRWHLLAPATMALVGCAPSPVTAPAPRQSPAAPASPAPAAPPAAPKTPNLSAATPRPAPAAIAKDVVYARVGPRPLTLDFYPPTNTPAPQPAAGPTAPNRPAPLVIWVHGGGWVGGSKANPPALFLREHGFAVASINYRFSTEATFPAAIHDAKAAVRYLRANAATLGIDPHRIGIWGMSAGGHTAALLGTSAGVPALDGTVGDHPGVSSAVQAVCNFCGIIDMLTMKRPDGIAGLAGTDSPDSIESRFVGGPVQSRREVCVAANPITYADRTDPPTLTMHGDADQLVPLSQGIALDAALKAAGVDSTLVVVKGGDHVFGGPEVAQTVLAFFQRTLAEKPK
jgi:acetyl esterase/lipase